MDSEAEPSLYEQIGGEENLRKAVEIFYKKIFMDGRVSHFFDNADMRRLYAHQSQFLAYALGGPDAYKGRDMREAHKELVEKHGLSEAHFNAVAEHLLSTLVDLGVEKETRDQIMSIVAGTKKDVLNV